MSTIVDNRRPTRAEIETAAIDLIRRYGAQILSTARRYSANLDDAEDAYQRALEIMLTKAPSTRESDLLPWIKTVVKHEAFALRRQRERHGQPTEHSDLVPAAGRGADTHEQVVRYERLHHGAEALRRLKPQEIRCMLLLAEGHSYAQIQEITGWSYTKVNRCLSEGRRTFLQRVSRIESGAECERLAPLLSAYADGEASEEDSRTVRRHLRTCLACRAALRETREVPARVAALAPAGAIVAGHGAAGGGIWHPLHSIASWLHHRATAIALRGQDLFEVASAHKVAAIAASAAVAAGGGAAAIETTAARPHRAPRHAHHLRVVPAAKAIAPSTAAQRPATAPKHTRAPRHRPQRRIVAPQAAPLARPIPPPLDTRPQAPPRPAHAPAAHPSHGDGSGEFGP